MVPDRTTLNTCMLSAALGLLVACSDYSGIEEEQFSESSHGVFVLCEGNYQSGNSSLSYYRSDNKTVENEVFYRANDRKLGDTGQSITIHDGTAYIAVENSGIVWGMDTETFKVKGRLTAGDTEHMVNPRYVHIVNDEKAYITDLYSPYITVFDPRNYTYKGSIPTGQPTAYGYCSTEQMVRYGQYVFTNCWCYSRDILVIDTETDAVCDHIELTSWQPKRMVMDSRNKLWVITDGGYDMESGSMYDNIPHLYRIDAETRTIEDDWEMDTDEASVELALDATGQYIYILNNDIYRMDITADSHPPVTPYVTAPKDNDGRRHKLYGIGVNPTDGDIYVADAVDYSQSGVVYRYSSDGGLIDNFRVGINPNGFAFK